MTDVIEKVLATLDNFRISDEITYSSYSALYDEISLLDDSLKAIVRCKDCKYGAIMNDMITYMCESPEQENRRCVHEHD